MSNNRLRVLGAALLALFAIAAVPAFGAVAKKKATVKIVGGPTFKINRFASDTNRFAKDAYVIRTGGTLTIANKSGAPHTFSIVKRSQLPRTAKQINNCRVCEAIGAAHGVPPNGDGPPTKLLVDVGNDGFDEPGDSIVVNPKKTVKVKITAKAGTTLRFMCAIHPWMQAKLKVAK